MSMKPNFICRGLILIVLLIHQNVLARIGPDEYDEIEQLVEMKIQQAKMVPDPAACAFIDVEVHCADPRIAEECSNNCTEESRKNKYLHVCGIIRPDQHCGISTVAEECSDFCSKVEDGPVCAFITDPSVNCEDDYVAAMCPNLCTSANCTPECVEGQGQCIPIDRCKCNDGYEGNHCQYPVCIQGCLNGNCSLPETCACDLGWIGELCDKAVCQHSCRNGACVGPDTCSCDSGWGGELCQDPICEQACINGECKAPSLCGCNHGWYGPRCQYPVREHGLDGIPGPPGPAGPKGEPGPAGQPGDKGETGLDGAKGEIGPEGPPGVQGSDGLPEINGPQGKSDATGQPGDKGETGLDGATGEIGPSGPDGWTIIQRRQEVDPRENFQRPWADYINGFGNIKREFWMGLKEMHRITTEDEHELHVGLEDWDGNTRYASYKVFQVGPAETNYKLIISGYAGDAGDAMTVHNGAPFTTTDQDNDSSRVNCADTYGGGGWWYKNCARSSLNGRPLKEAEGPGAQGIWWHQWLSRNYSLRSATMKIRPRERTA